jgi:catalase-peroxidase
VPQGRRKNGAAIIPDAFDKSKKHVPTMLTTDLLPRLTPPTRRSRALLRASWIRWTRLPARVQAHTARPDPAFSARRAGRRHWIWQDPIPAVNHPLTESRTLRP